MLAGGGWTASFYRQMNPSILSSPAGLCFEMLTHGAVHKMRYHDVLVNLFPGTGAEGGPANLLLRLLDESNRICGTKLLLGPESPLEWSFLEASMCGTGTWHDLDITLELRLDPESPRWFWLLSLTNRKADPVRLDVVHVQDIGIAHYGAVRLNEYYVSHYIDHQPLEHPARGWMVASRQNQPMGGQHPWTLVGSLRKAVSYATDGLQTHGRQAEADTPLYRHHPLPGVRMQHEHSIVGIQDEPWVFAHGETQCGGFFGLFVPHHPEATGSHDAERADDLPENIIPTKPSHPPSARPRSISLFHSAGTYEVRDVGEEELRAWFGDIDRHAERDKHALLSFFPEIGRHVVLREKEHRVLRPHGQIVHTTNSLAPDETALTSTMWMNGVFQSMVTQGHVSINRFLSTCHGTLGLFHSHGQRVFVDDGSGWKRLGMPSAFEMTRQGCRWIYQNESRCIEVVTQADDGHMLHTDIRVISGGPVRLLVSHHVAMNGDDGLSPGPAVTRHLPGRIEVAAIPDSDVGRRFPHGYFTLEWECPAAVESGDDGFLRSDGISVGEPFVCLRTGFTECLRVSIRGNLLDSPTLLPASRKPWQPHVLQCHDVRVSRLAELSPWLVENALVHYLAPRGLEQYSGGGWGTRDVCQGPVELLLGMGHPGPVRDILLRVFRQQNPDGDWPQWFMFFERERNIRPGDSHGDIVFWPLVALAEYLVATGDASILGESVPYFLPDGETGTSCAPIRDHVGQALQLIRHRVIPGTGLAAYGHGDWNDSLQPAKPGMRDSLCSAWTVTLHHQTLKALSKAMLTIGDRTMAAELEEESIHVLDAFQNHLVVNGVICGLMDFAQAPAAPLLHPSDQRTGLRYSVLPMIHAIIQDMLTPSQAAEHLEIIRQHLLGPDGVHLFDRPLEYHGGVMTNFQRAESAAYFGREIGNMYTHAHLRYCEAMARFGDAEGLLDGLSRINPIAIREIVASAAPRQANCYFSSSDPVFHDRRDAFDHYDDVMSGKVAFEGGWRVYSSGAGIGVRLLVQCFFGVSLERDTWLIDPVMPHSCDGLTVRLEIADRSLEILYRVGASGHGPTRIQIDGREIPFEREKNAYRTGGARFRDTELPGSGPIRMTVYLG